MKINNVIIQAGGLGSRMGALTKNRPKCMIPVHNKPMIFHMFDYFPKCNFVVICDYKDEVLKSYLETFSQVEYKIVVTREKGNVAGIGEAAKLLNEGPTLVVWSDLVLHNVSFDKLHIGNYVGVSSSIPCSRFYENNRFTREGDQCNGVAGLFLFEDNSILCNAPKNGSFVEWIEPLIKFEKIDLQDTEDIGTLERYNALKDNINRCRPYNKMVFDQHTVTKYGLTPEGTKLIQREVTWYKYMEGKKFKNIPKIKNYDPLIMERIEGNNIFQTSLDSNERKSTLIKIMDSLKTMHEYEKIDSDEESLKKEYYLKTIQRLSSISNAIPFSKEDKIMINGKLRTNVFAHPEILEAAIDKYISCKYFVPIHGDCTLTNTMISKEGFIYFIDARGYFGTHEIYGDPNYDWAKLYYSIIGNFDQFNIKNFELTIGEDSVEYSINSNQWEGLKQHLIEYIGQGELIKIKLIHSIIWLSLASHAWEDYDSMCLAFYNGLVLFDEFKD